MSSPNSQSRSSIDLGTTKPQDHLTDSIVDNLFVRNHPPRLQHSPSLPNIWIPPHSAPIRPDIIDTDQDTVESPPTPTLSVLQSSSSQNSMPMANIHQAFAAEKSLRAYDPSLTSNAHLSRTQGYKRQRRQREKHQSLLTPPLTPSSSIRTTTSLDSSGHQEVGQADPNTNTFEVDKPDFTRFLQIGNVSRKISSDFLESAISKKLKSTRSTDNGQAYKTHEDFIKGIFVRVQESHGVIYLAFFDVREAVRARNALAFRTEEALAECVEEGITENGKQSWFSCRFVTTTELIQTIGNSQFLATTDGTLALSVELADTQQDSRCEDSTKTAPKDGPCIRKNTDSADDLYSESQRRIINVNILRDILTAYGDLRSLSVVEDDTQDNITATRKFNAEFFDTRDADAAYLALDQQTMFGMKIQISSRSCRTKIASDEPSKNIVAFPCVPQSADIELKIGAPGQMSQMRERFTFSASPGKVRPRSVSAGHEASTLLPSVASFPRVSCNDPPAPSPTYFYTSSANDAADSTRPSILVQENNDDLKCTRDAVTKPCSIGHSESENSERLVPAAIGANDAPGPDQITTHWQTEINSRPDVYYHCYTSPHDCYYCPSRGPPPCAGYSPFFGRHSTPPLPSLYLTAPHQAPHSTAPVTIPPSVSPVNFGYEYEPFHVIGPATPRWPFEHGMVATPANGVVTSNMRPGLVSGPCWSPNSQEMIIPERVFYPPFSIAPDNCVLPFYPLMNESPVPLNGHVPSQPQIFVTNTLPPSPIPPNVSSSSTQGAISGVAVSGAQTIPPERNQLNLARIGEGQDTRTTVMIKNIPNKMSDKDLVAFIGKVCPRKIDFLYLRMDFQNGCNVGYAFVNFIHVQDLLCFAKKKLGEKWNMFSSEKVLQMSYANYQGKEALVEKFKNSCIMDEREAWRPKIFYSSGPEQGLPEPFPAPTHLRRKERSSYNRGALFVPGVGASSHTPHTLLHNTPRRQHSNNNTDGHRGQHGRFDGRDSQRYQHSSENNGRSANEENLSSDKDVYQRFSH